MPGDLVVVGQIARPHGVHGEIRVRPFTGSTDSWARFKKIYLRRPEGEDSLFKVVSARPHKDFVLLKLNGLNTREQVRGLVGAEAAVLKEWLPEPEEGEYYWTDLIGLSVVEENGLTLGRVENVLSTPGDDLLAVNCNGRELLVPFREEMIRDIDLEGRRILVSLPEGLLDL